MADTSNEEVVFLGMWEEYLQEKGERSSQVVHDEMQKYTQETVMWKGGMRKVREVPNKKEK